MMLTQSEGWPLDIERCPADRDLMTYLTGILDMAGKSIFHLGPGLHHIVGVNLAEREANVLSVTNCREEMTAYMDWAEANPKPSRFYKCMFADVHQLDGLPRFDVVTLFHLGELGDTPDYAHLSIEGVIKMFADRLTHRGRLIFYTRSSAWDKLVPILGAMVAWERKEFASLLVMWRE